MNIKSRELTTCDIAADGSTLSLGFIDAGGQPASLTLPMQQAGALLMTLPHLLEQALRVQYQDASLRYTYPLGSWTLEHSSDPTTGIMTLATPDGFSVRFSVARAQLESLGEALSTCPAGGLGNARAAIRSQDDKTSMH